MKKFFYIAIVSSIYLIGCDQIDDPIPADVGQSFELDGDTEFIVDPSLNIDSVEALRDFITSRTWDTVTSPDNSTQRFIVLEEFTGHTCNNCPAGAREIKRLQGVYGDQLIPIAIHSGNFAEPATSGSQFRTDFRVDGGHGETYLSDLNISALPQGIISRTTPNGRQINQWETDFLAIQGDAPIARLDITNYYSPGDTIVRAQIEIEWLTTSTESFNLQLHLLESKIVDWQLDGSTILSDYEHNHALRKVVNGTYGKPLQAAVAGEKEVIQYITTFKSEWVPDNMNVVAFIFNGDPSSYEIMQGNSADIK